MARLIDGLQAACRRGRRRGEWRLLCVVMVVLALGFVSVADAAEAAPKPEAKPAPPTPEVTVATSGKLVLDGQDADWLEVPVLIDGRKAKRPGRGLKRFLKVKTMKVAQKGNDLWSRSGFTLSSRKTVLKSKTTVGVSLWTWRKNTPSILAGGKATRLRAGKQSAFTA